MPGFVPYVIIGSSVDGVDVDFLVEPRAGIVTAAAASSATRAIPRFALAARAACPSRYA